MLIVMEHSVNYCLFFGRIANIEAMYVWFVYNNIVNRIAGSHICYFARCNIVQQQG